jgi:hypothetical protein
VILEVADFEKKVEELLNSDKEWTITYDIDRDQIKIVELDGEDRIVWHSQVLSRMSEAEYLPFRANLERLMPDAKPELGRFW